jgi:hypothetical protein
MKIDDATEPGLSQPAEGPSVPVGIEQLLEAMGVRYIADLRSLSEAFNEFYTSMFDARYAQLTQIAQRALATERERDEYRAALAERDAELGRLRERVRELERERDERAAVVGELGRIGARYVADLQDLARQIGVPVNLFQPIQPAGAADEPEAAVVATGAPEPEPAEADKRASARSAVKSAQRAPTQPALRFVGARYHFAKVGRFAGEAERQVAMGE